MIDKSEACHLCGVEISYVHEFVGIPHRFCSDECAAEYLRQKQVESLVKAAKCASNVLYLLETEVGRLGCGAENVKNNLDAAIRKIEGAA